MTEASHSAGRIRKTFLLLLGAVFCFRLWFSGTLPLSGDEAYHWEWSRHPAWGYYDHPGLTAYLILFFTRLLGRSTEWTVRLPALAMLTGTALVAYAWARRVARERQKGTEAAERAGLLAGVLVLIAPVFAVFAVYISTDPPAIFFNTLSLYLLRRALDDGGWADWLAAGAAVGLALLSKFLSFLMFPAVLLFVLCSPPDRRWWRRPQPYAAALCALAVLAPFLWWNATHDWATFKFNFVYRQTARGFSPALAAEFVAGQALALSPLLFGGALAGLWKAAQGWRRNGDRDGLYAALSALIPLGYFLCVAWQRRVGLHWPASGWAPALVWLGVQWAEPPPSPRARRWRRAALATALLLTIGLHAAVHLPPGWLQRQWSYGGSPRRINTGLQAERFGWRELGREVERRRAELAAARAARGLSAAGAAEGGVFVMAAEYGLAAGVAFYTPSQLPTHLWSARRTHGENYRFWDDYPRLRGCDAIYVSKKEAQAEAARAALRERFREVGEVERFPVFAAGREVRAFYLIPCLDFDGRGPPG